MSGTVISIGTDIIECSRISQMMEKHGEVFVLDDGAECVVARAVARAVPRAIVCVPSDDAAHVRAAR